MTVAERFDREIRDSRTGGCTHNEDAELLAQRSNPGAGGLGYGVQQEPGTAALFHPAAGGEQQSSSMTRRSHTPPSQFGTAIL